MKLHQAFVTDTTRVLLSLAILIYFGWALMIHWNTGLEEALKNVLLIVVGFWMGGAKRSASEPAPAAGEGNP